MSLTVIEAARISAIVEEALEKLSFLASITPDVMAHRDELSQIVISKNTYTAETHMQTVHTLYTDI